MNGNLLGKLPLWQKPEIATQVRVTEAILGLANSWKAVSREQFKLRGIVWQFLRGKLMKGNSLQKLPLWPKPALAKVGNFRKLPLRFGQFHVWKRVAISKLVNSKMANNIGNFRVAILVVPSKFKRISLIWYLLPFLATGGVWVLVIVVMAQNKGVGKDADDVQQQLFWGRKNAAALLALKPAWWVFFFKLGQNCSPSPRLRQWRWRPPPSSSMALLAFTAKERELKGKKGREQGLFFNHHQLGLATMPLL